MKCFVIMPFGKEGSPEHRENLEIFERVIKRAVVKSGMVAEADCIRVDLIDRSGSVVDDIVDGLHDAEVVIADLSRKNPNVFYELGARHVLRRGTILITRSVDDVPFSLQGDRLVQYPWPLKNEQVLGEFDRRITAHLRAIADNPAWPDSPFFRKIEYIGRPQPELELDMPIDQTHSSQQLHIYNMFIVIRNKGYKIVTNLDWEAYWPAGIAIKSRYPGMGADKEDPDRRGYIRFRNTTKDQILRPNSELCVMFVEFEVNDAVFDSGELSRPVFLRVYADNKPPIERAFPLQGSGRVNY